MASPLEILMAPLVPLKLSEGHHFDQIVVREISLAVDREARARIDAARGVAASGSASDASIRCLVEMMGQDRLKGVGDAVAAAFAGGRPTKDDGRDAENLVQFSEADLACKVVAAGALAEIGAPAVRALVDALGSAVDSCRSEAAKALGQIGSPAASAVPTLMQLAKRDGAETVRKAATDAVKALKPRR